jgi:hypothetical protein
VLLALNKFWTHRTTKREYTAALRVVHRTSSKIDHEDAKAAMLLTKGTIAVSHIKNPRSALLVHLNSTETRLPIQLPNCHAEEEGKTRVLLKSLTQEQARLMKHRSMWVKMFPCILEIALKNETTGVRRRPEETFSLLLKEPWMALGHKATVRGF